MEIGTVAVANGDQIEIKQEVRDPDLWFVWLHGAGSRKDNPRAEAANQLALEHGASFVALDARAGSGKSTTSVEDLTFEDWIADLRLVVTSCCSPSASVILMGHSRGAFTCAWGAVQDIHPNIKGVVMYSAGFGQCARRAEQLGPSGFDELQRLGHTTVVRRGENRVVTFRQYLSEIDHSDELLANRLKIPFLMIHGARDETVSIDLARLFYGRCNGGMYLELPSVDHRFLGREQEVLSFAKPFLSRVLGG